jgi:hypothetical protein
MKRRGNEGWAAMVAQAVADHHSVEPLVSEQPRLTTWFDDWIAPSKARQRSRRWLSMWLKGDLRGIPTDEAERYLAEMAADLRTVGLDEAVDRFIDKILPEIISNGGPA